MSNPIADFPWDWKNVTGTVLVKTGPGALHTVVLNGLTAVGDVVIYDGVDATGALLAELSLRTAVSVSFQPITFTYDCKIETGIYILYDQNVAANITVTYK